MATGSGCSASGGGGTAVAGILKSVLQDQFTFFLGVERSGGRENELFFDGRAGSAAGGGERRVL